MITNVITQNSDIDIISHKASLSGAFAFGNTVKIDGYVEGKISTTENQGKSILLIGQDAYINADIKCECIVIEGLVRGSINAIHAVEIKKTGVFLGNIIANNIIVHPGGILEGNCKTIK